MRHIRLRAVLPVIGAALVLPFVIFFIRLPVLIVTDAPFAALYGKSHLRRERRAASLALFRRVKPVMVADGAGPDVVNVAIQEAARRPLCVLFPRSQALAALRFHEQFPQTPAVLMSGLAAVSEAPSPDGFLCVYGVDRQVDLYRAGLFAGILGGVPQKPVKANKKDETTVISQNSTRKTYVLWQDSYVQAAGMELFSRGIREQDPESVVIFAHTDAEMPDMKIVSCAVLTGAGAEYLEKNPGMPLILFSWLDPAYTAQEVMALFDDSVWALAVPAVRMAVQKRAEGKIPSKPLIFSAKIAHNGVFRMLRKSAKKMP